MDSSDIDDRVAELVREWFDWLQDEARFVALDEAGFDVDDSLTASACELEPEHFRILRMLSGRQEYLRGYWQALMDARLSIDPEALEDLRKFAAATLSDWVECEVGKITDPAPQYNMASAPGQRRRYAVADITARRMGRPTRSRREAQHWVEQCRLARPEHEFVLVAYEGTET